MNNYDNPFASSLYTNVRSLHRCNDINGSPVCLDEHGWFWTGLQLLWSNLSSFRFSGENWNGPLATADDLDVIRVEIRYKDSAWGANYQVDIPMDLSEECYHYLPGMILELSGSEPGHWYVEPLYDDDTGWIPILRNRISVM